jgi:hypothetical protein
MFDKDFVPYNESLELKEIGFNEVCMAGYDGDDNSLYIAYISNDGVHYNPQYYTKAPLFSQAFRWIREMYDIHYSIERHCSQHDHKWGYNWSLYNYTGIFDEYLTSAPDAPVGEWVYNTYEEAELACIREIIKIVKNK